MQTFSSKKLEIRPPIGSPPRLNWISTYLPFRTHTHTCKSSHGTHTNTPSLCQDSCHNLPTKIIHATITVRQSTYITTWCMVQFLIQKFLLCKITYILADAGVGWKNNKARPTADVSAASFSALTLLEGWHDGHSDRKNPVPLIPRGPLPENTDDANQRGNWLT